MKKLLRKCLILCGVLFLLLVIVAVALTLVTRKLLSPEGLVELAEKEINSRVEIGEVDLDLIGGPATVTLRNVSLSPRTAEVDKPVGERAPVVDPAVAVKEVRLRVRLGALLKRRVEVTEFVFEEPHIAMTVYENGDNSLDSLLKSPEEAEASAGAEDGDPQVMLVSTGGGEDEVLNAKTLNIYAHGFLAAVKEVRLDRSSFDLTIAKTGMVIKGRNFDTRLDEIEVDPSALEKTNKARLRTVGRIVIDAVEDPSIRYASIGIEGPAEVVLFDAETGDFRPDVLADLALSPDSYLSADIPVIQGSWGAIKKLESFGIKLGELPKRATFGRSRSLSVRYHNERVTLMEPISIWFADWELAAMEESWIQVETEFHAARAELLASQSLSDKSRRELVAGLGHIPKELRLPVAEEVGKAWFRNGRLGAEVVSAGPLSKPKVSMLENLPDVGEILKKAGENFLRDACPESWIGSWRRTEALVRAERGEAVVGGAAEWRGVRRG